MSAVFPMDSVLPWQSDTDEDRRFKKWLFHGIGICCMVAALFPFLPALDTSKPVLERQRTEYTRLLIEERKIPEPAVVPAAKKPEPVVTKAKPKAAEKSVSKPVKSKPIEKPKPMKAVKTEKPKRIDVTKQAREKAAKSGVLAFADDLAAMRQREAKTQTSTLSTGAAKAVAVKRNLLAAKATAASTSGIAEVTLSQATGDVAFSERSGVAVESLADDQLLAEIDAESYAQSSENAGRSAQSVRKVMDANKGAVYGIYNRALRQNPTLVGQLSFSMVIEPSGKVSAVTVLNDELNDQTLINKLLARIRMINFGAEPVEQTTVNYSFDFLPS